MKTKRHVAKEKEMKKINEPQRKRANVPAKKTTMVGRKRKVDYRDQVR